MIPLLVPQEPTAVGAPPDARPQGGEGEETLAFGAVFAADDGSAKDAPETVLKAALPTESDIVDTELRAAVAVTKEPEAKKTALAPALPTVAERKDIRAASDVPAQARSGGDAQPQTASAAVTANRPPENGPLPRAAAPVNARHPTVAQSVVEGRVPQAKPELAETTKGTVLAKAVALEVPVRHGDAGSMAKNLIELPMVPAKLPVETAQALGPKLPVGQVTVGDGDSKTKRDRPEVDRAGPTRTAPVMQAQIVTANAPIVQPLAVSLAKAAQGPLEFQIEKQLKPINPDVGLGQTAGDRTSTISASLTGVGTSAGAGPDVARHAASQMAVVITNAPNKTTEIALNPEELGRVRLTMAATDGVITLNIAADRPETMDLLRRHIDALAQEFRNLGYDSMSFSFGSEAQGGTDDDTAETDQIAPSQAEGPVEHMAATDPSPSANTGLDLRL